MDYYQIWCNLKESSKDLEFCKNLKGYMNHLQQQGLIKHYNLSRRKLGFGPAELGEFNITIAVNDLAQLEQAFSLVATRDGDVERLHRAVFSSVTDFRSALYRDFPDSVRVTK